MKIVLHVSFCFILLFFNMSYAKQCVRNNQEEYDYDSRSEELNLPVTYIFKIIVWWRMSRLPYV
jgi:hypothetical protein